MKASPLSITASALLHTASGSNPSSSAKHLRKLMEVEISARPEVSHISPLKISAASTTSVLDPIERPRMFFEALSFEMIFTLLNSPIVAQISPKLSASERF